MWGIFIGLAIGVLQVLALSILGKMILSGDLSAKMLGVLLLIAKIAVIVLILYLVSTISLTHVVWTAVGMLIGLIIALVFIQIRNRRKHKMTNSITDRKDNSDV